LVGVKREIIPVKFGQNPMSGFRAVKLTVLKKFLTAGRTMDDGQQATTKACLEDIVLR